MAQELSKHLASDQAAGYLFETSRALFWLAKIKGNESVAVELVDDVSVQNDNGEILLMEQDKHSRTKSAPYNKHSKDLWNTLYIWIKAIEERKVKFDNIKFLLVTNKEIGINSILSKLITADSDDSKLKLICDELTVLKSKTPKHLISIIPYIEGRIEILKLLIPKIEVSGSNTKQELDKIVVDLLHLSGDIADKVLNQLRGWVVGEIIHCWEDNEPAVLHRSCFDICLKNAISDFNGKKIVERRKRDIISETDFQVSKNKISKDQKQLFIQQLELLEIEDEDMAIEEAIEDYLCAKLERLRLAKEGSLTKPELTDFDDRLFIRWREIFRVCNRRIASKSDDELKDIGFQIYHKTVDEHLENLAGEATTQPYLTKGSYQELSNEFRLGWHPKWKEALTFHNYE